MFQSTIVMVPKWFNNLLLFFSDEFYRGDSGRSASLFVAQLPRYMKADSAKSSLNSMDVSVDHFEEHLV